MNITFIVDFPEYCLQIYFYFSPLTWPWICSKLLSYHYCTDLFSRLLIYTTFPMLICRCLLPMSVFHHSFPIGWVQLVFSPVLTFRCLCPLVHPSFRPVVIYWPNMLPEQAIIPFSTLQTILSSTCSSEHNYF